MSDGRARSARVGLVLLASLYTTVAAQVASPIETDGATKLTVGVAPQQGWAIVDPVAQTGTPPTVPVVAAPTPFGAPPAGPPAFDVGPGGPALVYSGTQTLPGGT